MSPNFLSMSQRLRLQDCSAVFRHSNDSLAAIFQTTARLARESKTPTIVYHCEPSAQKTIHNTTTIPNNDCKTIATMSSISYYPSHYNPEDSPHISRGKMIKELSSCNRVQEVGVGDGVGSTYDFLSAASKRKREEIDEISASRQLLDESEEDDDYIFPLHKRAVSSTRPLFAMCMSEQDSECRDGPAEDTAISSTAQLDDDVLDDETAALVSNFRTSIFRRGAAAVGGPPVSPSTTASSRPQTPQFQDADDDEHDNFPSIGRATTICDASDSESSDGCYIAPPDMGDDSRPTSPQEELLLEQEDVHHEHTSDWSSSELSLEYHPRRESEKDAIESAREHPEWTTSSATSISSSFLLEPSKPSPLWKTSSDATNKKEAFWPANWTGAFHQGSA